MLTLEADGRGGRASQRRLAARVSPRLHVLRLQAGAEPADPGSLDTLLTALSRVVLPVAGVMVAAPTSNSIRDRIPGNRNCHCGVYSGPDSNFSLDSLHGTPPWPEPVADNDPQPPHRSAPQARFHYP